jgi:predicted DNA-binding helix-hairpin-helix protein
MSWQVQIKPKVAKSLKNRQKIPMEVESATIALLAELETSGPAVNWPNYGKLKN